MVKMRSKRKQGLMTGEAAKMLGVITPTVIRYFNKGILTGWRNPITGRRLIDPESVKALKRKRKWKWRQAVIPVTRKEG